MSEHPPLTDAELDELEQLWKACGPDSCVVRLIAEVRRLRADVERKRHAMLGMMANISQLRGEYDIVPGTETGEESEP